MAFFVHIPFIYQISTYTSFYTRTFDFSHFCDFHIPFVYQNSHVPTHTPEFLTYTCCIPIWLTSFFVFCCGQTFSWRYLLFFLDTYQGILSMWSLKLNQCEWKYAKNILSKTHSYIISTCSLSEILYILYIYIILLVACLEVDLHKKDSNKITRHHPQATSPSSHGASFLSAPSASHVSSKLLPSHGAISPPAMPAIEIFPSNDAIFQHDVSHCVT